MNTAARINIANTIIAQMGGAGRLSAMTGAHSFSQSARGENAGVTFKFKGCKAHKLVQVILDEGSDTYAVRFSNLKIRKAGDTKADATGAVDFIIWTHEATDVYAENLAQVFTSVTGLYTSL